MMSSFDVFSILVPICVGVYAFFFQRHKRKNTLKKQDVATEKLLKSGFRKSRRDPDKDFVFEYISAHFEPIEYRHTSSRRGKDGKFKIVRKKENAIADHFKIIKNSLHPQAERWFFIDLSRKNHLSNLVIELIRKADNNEVKNPTHLMFCRVSMIQDESFIRSYITKYIYGYSEHLDMRDLESCSHEIFDSLFNRSYLTRDESKQ